MTLLLHVGDTLQISEAGAISALAADLLDEYQTMGYSLTQEDLETILINDYKFYAGWAYTQEQRKSNHSIDKNTVISIGEWGIISQMIRHHCDYMHAQRMEGSASLGGERFGIDSISARQSYEAAQLDVKKDAFVEEVFTIDFDYVKP
ncbi:hypothetical protein DJ533_00250 (plasmid) [Acinetobacter defluvii]|uniref:Uncharacterized protein n=1 Tax=Acinetobacter defluvii TaxID=1871111 RepID=A0A2S2F8A7_9GAMM|nr:hypothetical protein [Acinetobacter defluvii]AWL27150.1 hypothetical protein DJ533_00250 [Acinetobacter defluvii]